MRKKKLLQGAGLMLLSLTLLPLTVFAAEAEAEYTPAMYATFWALVPPIVAIVLALIKKEVYSSLFIGILVGGLFRLFLRGNTDAHFQRRLRLSPFRWLQRRYSGISCDPGRHGKPDESSRRFRSLRTFCKRKD